MNASAFHPRMTHRRQARRAARQGSGVFVAAVVVAVSLAGILLLLAADASARDVRHDRLPLILLAVSFVALLVVMALASASGRMQFGLQMFTIYMTIYLILPGYHHMSMNVFPFYGLHYDDGVLRGTAITVSAFTALLLAGYVAAHPARARAPRRLRAEAAYRLRGSLPLAATLTALAIMSLVLIVAIRGPAAVFATRSAAAADPDAGSSLLLPVFGSIILASAIYAVILARFGADRRAAWTVFALNVPVFLVGNWPPGLSRFALFGFILLFALLTLDFRRHGARIAIPFLFVFGALVAMPLVDSLTRNANRGTGFSYSHILDQYFSSGDFDGMQSINNATLYGREHGYTHGRQIVSAALFFIPRSVWSGKGKPTGTITSEAAGFKFTNISQPLPSEFFVDFGMAGVLIGGFLVGVGLARIDVWIDRRWEETPKARLIAGIVVSYSIIIYRGTLLGIIAGPASILVISLFIASFGLRRAARPDRGTIGRPGAERAIA